MAFVIGLADRVHLGPEVFQVGHKGDAGERQRCAVKEDIALDGRDGGRGFRATDDGAQGGKQHQKRAARSHGGESRWWVSRRLGIYGAEIGSPMPRVESACNSGRSALLVSVMNRTEPSAKAKLAPPVWPLPNAHTRSSSAKFGGPVTVPGASLKFTGTGVLRM